MNDKKLDEMLAVMNRVEGKIDAAAINFETHVLEDQAMGRQLDSLMKQRGFVRTSLTTVGVGIGVAITWAAHKFIGRV